MIGRGEEVLGKLKRIKVGGLVLAVALGISFSSQNKDSKNYIHVVNLIENSRSELLRREEYPQKEREIIEYLLNNFPTERREGYLTTRGSVPSEKNCFVFIRPPENEITLLTEYSCNLFN